MRLLDLQNTLQLRPCPLAPAVSVCATDPSTKSLASQVVKEPEKEANAAASKKGATNIAKRKASDLSVSDAPGAFPLQCVNPTKRARKPAASRNPRQWMVVEVGCEAGKGVGSDAVMEAEVEADGEAGVGVDALDDAMDNDGAPQPPVAAASTSKLGSSSAAGPSTEAPEHEVEVRLHESNALLAKGIIDSSEALLLRRELVWKSVPRS